MGKIRQKQKKGGNLRKGQTASNPDGEEDGTKDPMIIEVEMGEHFIHRIYVDGGSSSEILYEHCFNRFRPKVRSQMVLSTTPLVGFSGEIIWPLGSPSPYNGIIGRPGVRRIQAVLSTAQGMLKFPVTCKTVMLRSSRIIPLECTMVSGPGTQQLIINQVIEENIKLAVMAGVPRHIVEHRLNIREGCLPVRQKKRGQAPERNKTIYKEVEKLVNAGIIKKVHYHSWLSNPVMVKKHDDSWRMCVDLKDLNKACPKDGYPLSEID
ncbi:hypothetical protein Tco_0529403 [Tanacetum coccineum]